MKKKNLFFWSGILAVLLLVPVLRAAQNSQDTTMPGLDDNINIGLFFIEGFVIDEDKNGVPEADVLIPGKNVVVKTGLNGYFIIPILESGSMHVEVYKAGYLPAATREFQVRRNESIKLPRITLYPSIMEEVVVTGTATPKLYRETPVKTSVATASEIENKGAVSLADSLEIMTGVRTENNCQNCNFTQVRINGMEGKYSQILIDGQPVISSLAGVYALEQIPANMIAKLEVVKGGGSALYGGNAVAGVVNVVLKEATRNASRLSFTQEAIHGAPNSIVNINNDFVAKESDTRASFFANFQRRDPMDYDDDGFSDLGELTNVSFGSNFSHYFNRISGKFKMNFSSIFEDRRGGNKLDFPEHMADIAESIRTRRTDLGLGWEQTFAKESILKFNASYSFTKRKSYYGAQQDPNAWGQTSNPVFNANLLFNNFSLDKHSLLAGISFQADILDDRAPAYQRTIDETYNNYGLFVQDEMSMFGDAVTLLLGARADKHSKIESLIVSPRASLLYKGLKNLTLRATFSSGFRAPQVFDEDLHITQVNGEGQLIVNRAGLREEKSHSYTLGIDFGKQACNKLYQFSIGAFHNQIENAFTLAEIDPLPNAAVFERFNGGGVKVYGFEAEAGFKWAGIFEIFTGWTLQKSELDEPEPDFGCREIFRSPGLYGSVRVGWETFGLLDLHLEVNYTGSMKVPHFAGYIEEDILETTDPFWVVNLSANREIAVGKGRSFVLNASILNIFDRFQEDLDKGRLRDAGYVYGPRIPRTFRCGIKYNF
ncbi:MAG: TonB-dependent receptor [Acidobacteria bacterium]|nr:TonB-dependent receptor [Acidobacteriota bacterium]MBU4308056.1 TonB-dependent receptor [Acidobacteriota bacterium]MBU4405491.1 TonB-dependent receptor [Acidobacteriota bacterium]MCG2810082.1 TonB-dependent receptor [Candidatus Aminicenantes bacterium]